jgi:hypothetical protein
MAQTRIDPIKGTTTCHLNETEYQLVIQALVQSAVLAEARLVAPMDYFCFLKSLTRKDSAALAKFRKLVEKDPILALACDFIAGKPKLTEIEAEVVDEKPKISSTPPTETPKTNEPPKEEANTGLN